MWGDIGSNRARGLRRVVATAEDKNSDDDADRPGAGCR
jgi:hypothetical protein